MPSTAGSPSPSSTSSATTATEPNLPNPNPNPSGMQSWWESVSKARSRILSLSSLLSSPELASLADSDRPARSLLSSSAAYSAVSAALSSSSSGSGDDPLCHWLYDTFLLSSDPDLRLVVVSFLPLLSSLYLSRLPSSPSLAGFEAVLLAVYSSEVKSRAGKPLLVSVPDLSLPSLYHSPRPVPRSPRSPPLPQPQPSVSILSPPLEPQVAVKSTKRACIIAVSLDCYYRSIALMPACSKLDLCEAVAAWAGQYCPCRFELDDDVELERNLSSFSSLSPSSSSSSIEVKNFGAEEEENGKVGSVTNEMARLEIGDGGNANHCNGGEERRGARVALPWELLQPVLRILGHCLLAPLNSKEVRDAASVAVRCVYARASHELMPQAILAARSLIQLDKGARKAAKESGTAMVPSTGSNPNTPSKPKKPEILLVSK
ncbi:uncharacterized protein [Typha latifolia]|uniref:uncharacterized protein n=1 Tax=Typha latifolia TaxID=4733 RepID=UPI003C2E1061